MKTSKTKIRTTNVLPMWGGQVEYLGTNFLRGGKEGGIEDLS